MRDGVRLRLVRAKAAAGRQERASPLRAEARHRAGIVGRDTLCGKTGCSLMRGCKQCGNRYHTSMLSINAQNWLRKATRKAGAGFEAKRRASLDQLMRELSGRRLAQMTGGEFRDILRRMEEHWSTLQRLNSRLAGKQWPRTRRALLILAEERKSLVERLDAVRPPDRPALVPHLAQAVVTSFLHIRNPEKYCVWNGTAEEGMRLVGVWPEFPRAATFGEKYLLINAGVAQCSRQTGISLVMLDHLWWRATQELQSAPLPQSDDIAGLEGGMRQLVARTKRNREIIRKAKLVWSEGGTISPPCDVCGWSMAQLYGKHGFGFIEAHHNEPLGSTLGERITRISELSPVCPNCHAILHRSGLTIEDLRAEVNQLDTNC